MKKNVSKFKKMRLLSGMNQQQLASILKCTQGYISLIEREKVIPSHELQQKLDRLFGILEEME